MAFFARIGSDRPGDTEKAVQALCISATAYTSTLLVQAYQRVNVGIWIGSQISDIISAKGGVGGSVIPGALMSAIFSTASMSITLQRQMVEEMGTDYWHDVDAWSVTVAEGEAASSENVSDKAEPEPVIYRVGTKAGAYESGAALVRLGTS
ncbi:hypothetical protein LCGC14_2343500 [marine sediment metagenome]|uniref:Uncharacterized protein n=1 Tax=marine sediment metagenome TaxID=412755 RepID=A0A0F9ENY9_9ZZZZ